MTYEINEAEAGKIADALSEEGHIICENILDQNLVQSLYERINSVENLKEAHIGRGAEQQKNRDVRSDKTAWLDGDDPSEKGYLEWMESLRKSMNRALFLGLFDYEAHFAYYEKGAFYKKHSDVLRGSNNRLLTTVFYLTPDWQEGDGGELLIYDEEGKEVIERVSPRMGTMVIFLSEKFPHEVLESRKERYSIAGWFRVNASSSTRVNTMH